VCGVCVCVDGFVCAYIYKGGASRPTVEVDDVDMFARGKGYDIYIYIYIYIHRVKG